jgi:hypothetical protein
VLTIYAIGMQLIVGIRADMTQQLSRGPYLIEIVLLAAVTLSSIMAAILAMYPDAYQRPRLLKIPYATLALLLLFIGIQLLMPHDARMVMPGPHVHNVECSMAIAAIAMIPSALIFALLRKGASVHPLQAGLFAALAASGISCLTLRIAEANDSLIHLITWHYLPILLFAALGALIGKRLFRW